MFCVFCHILTFSKQEFNTSLDFSTVHSPMNDTNLIDSYQVHLPVQYASNIEITARSDTGVVIDREPHPSRTCKTCLLFAPLAFVVTLAVAHFRFTLRQNR